MEWDMTQGFESCVVLQRWQEKPQDVREIIYSVEPDMNIADVASADARMLDLIKDVQYPLQCTP